MQGIIGEMQQRENIYAVTQAEGALTDAHTAYLSGVRQSRLGNAANGVSVDTAKWWQDNTQRVMDSLTNDEQRNMLRLRATAMRSSSLRDVSRFEGAQKAIGREQTWKADKIAQVNAAAANPTPDAVIDSVTRIRQLNQGRAIEQGWGPAVLQAEIEADITNLHKQVIQQLVATNKDQAAAYFKAHEQEINGSKRAELGEFAQKATAAFLGSQAAQDEWLANGPKSDTDAADIDVMAAHIREQFKNDTYTRDAALTELKQMKTERDAGIQSRDAKRTATVNELLMQGKSLAAVQQTPAWIALDGTEQRKIVEHETNLAAARESRAAARESRAYTAESRAQHKLNTAGLDAMIRLSDPGSLVNMTRDDLINLRTTIGDQNTVTLLNKWDTLTKSGQHLTEARLDAEQFKVFALRAGLDITPTGDANKEKLVQLKDRAERIIAAEQQAKKRPLSRAEKDEILQKEIDNTVIQNAPWYEFDKPVPAIALPIDEQANAYVEVGPSKQKVVLSTIPADFRAQATVARRQQGLRTTEAQIAELWLRKNGRYK